jgi:hypothetical protein
VPDLRRFAVPAVLATVVGIGLGVAGGQSLAVVALTAVFVAGYLVSVPTAGSRRVTLAGGVATAVVLTGRADPVLVFGSVLGAVGPAWIITRIARGRRSTAYVFPAEPAGVLVFAAITVTAGVFLPSTEPSNPWMLGVVTSASLVGFGATVTVRALVSGERRVVSQRLIALRSAGDWPAHAALYASSALFSVTVEEMGLWAVPLAGLPYLFSHLSLRWLERTRRAYDQTIRALGAIPEAAAHVAAGHSERTSELAVAIGAEIGLGVGELRDLDYAAVLHDIGRVVLSNPAVNQVEPSFSDVSQWSAAIIGEVRFLDRVASIVALQHAPYRREGEVRDPTVPRASQVVRIAARFDSATAAGATSLEAVESLHRGAAYDYDPEIVMALRRVLERRGGLAA